MPTHRRAHSDTECNRFQSEHAAIDKSISRIWFDFSIYQFQSSARWLGVAAPLCPLPTNDPPTRMHQLSRHKKSIPATPSSISPRALWLRWPRALPIYLFNFFSPLIVVRRFNFLPNFLLFCLNFAFDLIAMRNAGSRWGECAIAGNGAKSVCSD